MSGDEVLHICISQGTRDGKHSIDAIVQDETTSTRNTLAFVLITSFVVVGESKRLAIAAQYDTSIADVRSIQDSLT